VTAVVKSLLLRRWAAAAACSASLGGMLPCGSLAAEAPSPTVTVQAPHYGDALFYFFQDQYFTAVTGLMVSQTLHRVAPHDDEAEVLRGGLLLSYGLHRQAAQVFERLVERGTDPATRRRAWYFLAKIRYQRGLVQPAADALARIDGPLPPQLADDHALLQAQVQMALGQYGPAADALRGLAERKPAARASGWASVWTLGWFGQQYADDETDRATRYARFNLGVALIRSGQRDTGVKILDELGQQAAGNEEMRALRDQANVALGYSALQAEEPENARKWLERVRLNGPASNKALLGFGWAALSLKQPKLALVPWTELAKRDSDDAAVLEARLAMPYALTELGAIAPAAAQYEQTLGQYAQSDQQLDESIIALRNPGWLDALLTLNPGEEMGALRQISRLPQMPAAGHLRLVMAQNDFQEAFKNHRDLRFLQTNLADWRSKLASYRAMLEHRREFFDKRLPVLHAQTGGIDLAPRKQMRDQLGSELAQATTDGDGLAFADARQRSLLGRAGTARDTLDRLAAAPDAPDTAAQRERLRLLSGVLSWELAEAYPERAWQARKGLQQLGKELDTAGRRLEELIQAEGSERQRLDSLGQRLEVMARRVEQLAPQVAALSGVQQQALQTMAIASLQQQKERLAGYTTQARFALAQLHDQALERTPGTGDSPAKPEGANAKP